MRIFSERERSVGIFPETEKSLGENILIEDSVGIFSETEERESW